jgi:hypothetical protein
LGGGKVSIVTFNYDISLEEYCYHVLVNRYLKTPEQAREALNNLQITHVYGTLGPVRTAHGEGRDYGPIGEAAELAKAAKNISTCYEKESVGAVAEARRLIGESEVVMFLGFGYSKENLDRLNFGETVPRSADILGSVYRCPDWERHVTKHLESGRLKTTGSETASPAKDALDSMWKAANIRAR